MREGYKENLTIINTTRGKLSRLPFLKIKERVLGNDYRLSIVFISKERSRTLNCRYRRKNKATNILSFRIEKGEGELYISPSKVKEEMRAFKRSFKNLLIFLIIHGLFHLKGMQHGSKMEEQEARVRKEFGA